MNNLNYRYTIVVLSRLGLSFDNKYIPLSHGSMQVIPDVGSTAIMLPNPIAYQVYAELGVSYDGTNAWIDCSQFSNATTLDFVFGSTTISVPMSEFVVGINDTTCTFFLHPTVDNSTTLGIAFLRRAYVVYDYSNNQLSIAPTNPGSATDNITVIGQNGVSGLGFVGTGSRNPTSNTTTPPSSASSMTTHPHAGLTTRDDSGQTYLTDISGHRQIRLQPEREQNNIALVGLDTLNI